jgi:feruloyl esterase
MEQWIEEGRAPGQLVAANTRAGYTRPLCEWPKTPRYTRGDPNQASSFRCE